MSLFDKHDIIEDEIYKALCPIVEKWAGKSISIREIQLIVNNTTNDICLSALLDPELSKLDKIKK